MTTAFHEVHVHVRHRMVGIKMDSQEEWWCYESCRDKGSVWPKLCYETTCSRWCVRQPFTVELFVMCQTVFQKFSEEKPRENLKNKKNTIFQRYWKAEKCKTKKTSRKQKVWPPPLPKTSGILFFLFFLFSRGFFGFALFCFPRPLENCFFFGFCFFCFSRGFCTFSKGPSPKILKMSFLICSSRLYFSFVYCYAFFGRNSALMLLFFISFVAFHI